MEAVHHEGSRSASWSPEDVNLAAFIGEYDMPHGNKGIGHSDSYLASQVIVATSGKTECVVVC
jgi:hypothetical protein